MRKAFNFYRSFYDVYKELNDKQAKDIKGLKNEL